MTDFGFMLTIKMFAGLIAVVVGMRYLRRSDKPKRRAAPMRNYNHTNYYVDRAVFINADPSSSRSSFQVGRGVALPAAAVHSLPRGEQLILLEASRPLKSASDAEKQAFARRQDMIMRGYA